MDTVPEIICTDCGHEMIRNILEEYNLLAWASPLVTIDTSWLNDPMLALQKWEGWYD